MQAFVVGLFVVGALSFARPAHAQFQNHSIGLAAGYLYLQPEMSFSPAALPPALALDATLYIESGFDVGLRFAAAIQKDKGIPGTRDPSNVVVLYPAAQARYFLREDYFRPYVGLSLEFLHAFDSDAVSAVAVPSDNYVGLAPMVGFEYFVADEWSVGLAGAFAGYFALNAGPNYSVQLWGRVATHF